MRSKIILTFLALLLFDFSLMAQTRITGVVSDASGPIGGVSVIEQDTKNGTVTDVDGKFVLTVKPGAKIIFSSIGYDDQVVAVGTQTNFNILMKESNEMLDETVVVGYGTQKKSDVTGSLASVDTKTIAARSPIDIAQGLQGAAAGVVVTQSSGDPDGGYNIRIRGVGTIQGDTNPLWVVDGVQYGTSSNLNWLDPQDVESMEILKDASATAIYGARGANGVILVTTKKGKAGKIRVDFRGNFGVSVLSNKLKMLSLKDWLKAYRESLVNDGRTAYHAFDGNYDDQLHEIDWQDTMTHSAFRRQYNVSVSGGSEALRANFSVGYLDNEGIVVNSWSKRLNMRLNVDYTVTPWLSMGLNMGFNTRKNRGGGNLISYARIVPTMDYVDESTGKLVNVPVKYPDGTFGHFLFDDYVDYTGGRYQTNPYADQYLQKYKRDWDNDNGSVRNAFYAEVKIMDGLTFRTNLNYDFSGSNGWTYTPGYIDTQYEYAQLNGQPAMDEFSTSGSGSTSMGAENYLTYDKTFAKKHHLTVMVGQSASKFHASVNGSSTKDLTFNFLRGFFSKNPTDYNNGSGGPVISTKFASYFARLNYSYDSRYMLTATMRRDGSSNFGKSNRWGNFPSFSFAWNAGEEKLVKKLGIFDSLKFRAGWGETGNANVDPTASVAQLSAGGTSFTYFDAKGNQNRIVGISQTREIDTGLHWETSIQTNIGIDMAFFKNSLTFSADWYNRKSRDLILDKTIRPSAGFNKITTNFGSIRNRGLEFALGYKKQINPDWYVSASATASTNWNKAIDIGSGTTVSGANGAGWDDRQVCFNGHPLGTFQGYKVVHIIKDQSEIDALNAAAAEKFGQGSYYDHQTTGVGDFLFADLNHDGHITSADKYFMGNGFPGLVYGLNLSVTFRNWDATAYMYGELGKKILSWSKCYLTTIRNESNGYFNMLDYAKDYYSPTNTDAKFPRITRTDASLNTRVSDFYVEKGDYLKISNVQIGYTFNKDLFKGFIGSARVYAQVYNLATISPYTKYGDPEIASDVTTTGYDGGRYPFPRTFMFGIQLGF